MHDRPYRRDSGRAGHGPGGSAGRHPAPRRRTRPPSRYRRYHWRNTQMTRRLLATELRLLLRDPLIVFFVLLFPIVSMLVIGGSFGTAPDPGFDNTNPSH